ncbi:NAD(P)-binding domain-containing protein [Streptomyces sp. NPDC002889]|uniref:NAD(P)-binding domain-containing protein n=1 Tax=Streptomyces sp. NPDC002889 TaxID=3364669 RepID=UPI0036B0164A
MAETPLFRVILRMEIKPGTQDEFESTWWEVGSAIARQPANRGQTLSRTTEGDRSVYYVVTDWLDEASFRTFELSQDHVEHRRRLGKYRTKGDMITTQTVYDIPSTPQFQPESQPRATADAVPRPADDKRAALAFVGLGNMGGGMAHALIDAGHRLTVYNRTEAKARPLVDAGAVSAAGPAEAARGHSVVVLSLSDEAAVDDVLFGRIAPVLAPGSIVIDTSTVSPEYARKAAARLGDAGLRRVEACVVGNPFQAREGKLRVYTSGAEQDAAEVAHILDAIGSEVLHLGAPGTAATLKLIFNLLLGAQVASLSEAVAYGVRAGLDRDGLLTAIAGSGFSSLVMRFRAELMRKGAYEPAFFRSALMEKDLRLALDDATATGVELPVLDTVRAGFAAVVAAGDGEKDASVLIEHTVIVPAPRAAGDAS